MAARMIGVAPKITTLQNSSEALYHDTVVGCYYHVKEVLIFLLMLKLKTNHHYPSPPRQRLPQQVALPL